MTYEQAVAEIDRVIDSQMAKRDMSFKKQEPWQALEAQESIEILCFVKGNITGDRVWPERAHIPEIDVWIYDCIPESWKWKSKCPGQPIPKRRDGSPFQIRLELLSLARNIVRHGSGPMGYEKLTTEAVIREAEKLNAFVSNGGAR